MEELSLDEIMKGNVETIALRSKKPRLTVYINSSTLRLNKAMRKDLGDPKRIAFFVTGQHAFFIAEPEASGLHVFAVRTTEKEASISSIGLVNKMIKAFNVKKEPSLKLTYTSHSTNKFGIIFKLCKEILIEKEVNNG